MPVFSNRQRSRAEREALVLWEVSIAAHEVRDCTLDRWTKLNLSRLGRREEEAAVRDVERVDEGLSTLGGLGMIRGLSHVHDRVAPGALSISDVGFVHHGLPISGRLRFG